MIQPNRILRGKQVVGTVANPRISKPSSGQIDDLWKGLLVGTAPTFGSATISGSGWTVPVSNYDTLTDYSVSTTAGSASFATGTVTQSGLGYSTSATVTVVADKTGYTAVSATNTQTTSAAPCVPAGCTPPSCTLTSSTSQGSNTGNCAVPGCTTGCLYYTKTTYTYIQPTPNYCVDNCGVVYYSSCPANPAPTESTPYICGP